MKSMKKYKLKTNNKHKKALFGCEVPLQWLTYISKVRKNRFLESV
jgi:hypothetical protein